MFTKTHSGRKWLVISLNVAVIAVVAVVTLSLPYFVNAATNPAVFLKCYYVADPDPLGDKYYVWQLCEMRGDEIVTAWDAIYAAYERNPQLLQCHPDLTITRRGLVFEGDARALAGFTNGWVQFRGRRALVRLPV